MKFLNRRWNYTDMVLLFQMSISSRNALCTYTHFKVYEIIWK